MPSNWHNFENTSFTVMAAMILLHYSAFAEDYPFRNAPAEHEALRKLEHLGLIMRTNNGRISVVDAVSWELTERGQVLAKAMCNMPLPQQQWAMPSAS